MAGVYRLAYAGDLEVGAAVVCGMVVSLEEQQGKSGSRLDVGLRDGPPGAGAADASEHTLTVTAWGANAAQILDQIRLYDVVTVSLERWRRAGGGEPAYRASRRDAVVLRWRHGAPPATGRAAPAVARCVAWALNAYSAHFSSAAHEPAAGSSPKTPFASVRAAVAAGASFRGVVWVRALMGPAEWLPAGGAPKADRYPRDPELLARSALLPASAAQEPRYAAVTLRLVDVDGGGCSVLVRVDDDALQSALLANMPASFVADAPDALPDAALLVGRLLAVRPGRRGTGVERGRARGASQKALRTDASRRAPSLVAVRNISRLADPAAFYAQHALPSTPTLVDVDYACSVDDACTVGRTGEPPG
ncbi:hypothetical protein M885DRAFT_535664 [Pelagophyceae sp. CCMP2097]|nr:hypothetical protein M885DRAFT_535664 [Pelagophyceae sp. CCMP2097]